MRVNLGLVVYAAMATLALAACGSSPKTGGDQSASPPQFGPSHSDTAEASSRCLAAMKELSEAPTAEVTGTSVTATLKDCADVGEWLNAARVYPKALGLTSMADIGDLEVQIVCHPAHSRQFSVCVDAAAKGIIK